MSPSKAGGEEEKRKRGLSTTQQLGRSGGLCATNQSTVPHLSPFIIGPGALPLTAVGGAGLPTCRPLVRRCGARHKDDRGGI